MRRRARDASSSDHLIPVRRRWIWLALAAAVVTTACGRGADPDDPGGHNGSPRVVKVGPERNGETIDLRAGDELRILPLTGEAQQWVLSDHPEDVLSFLGDRPFGDSFEFRASRAGEGTVTLLLVPDCGPPLPEAGDIECPLGGPNEDGVVATGSPPTSKPLATFTVTVRVT